MGLVIDLVQGTPEWLRWRFSGIGGSDAAAALDLSPYKTRRELALEKINKAENVDESKEFIFARGHKVEKVARRLFQELTGEEMNPVCLQHPKFPQLLGSLDGQNRKIGDFEAKYVGAEVVKRAFETGEIPEHHRIQIQHNMNVSGSDKAHWYGLDSKENGALIEVGRDEKFIRMLEDEELKLWDDIQNGRLPALGPKDYLEPEDVSKLIELRDAKELFENAEMAYELLKKQVIESYSHDKIRGGGVQIFKVDRAGSLNMLDIPEIAEAVELLKRNLDPKYIETFRKKGSSSFTVKPIVTGRKQ